MIRYGILLEKHANIRYEQSIELLAQAEFALIAKKAGVNGGAKKRNVGPLTLWQFECETLSQEQIDHLSNMSTLCALFEIDQQERLLPLTIQKKGAFYELPSIMKYKGKTNEQFTRFLINMARYSSDLPLDEKMLLFDPMCGRGTTIFCAMDQGMDACGVELDKKEIREGSLFLKNYLQRARVKYQLSQQSKTTKQGPVAEKAFEFKSTALEKRASIYDGLSLRFWIGDARQAKELLGKKKADLIVSDLPYGIVHGNAENKKGKDTLRLLKACLPQWQGIMRSGGAMALSFNSYTLSRVELHQALEEAGFIPCEDAPYDACEHWVEQAVMRDIVVAKKR